MMATIFSVYLWWFFRVSAVLFLGFLGDIGVCVCMCVRVCVCVGRGDYKVVGHRVSSCIQVVLLCWCFPRDILLFRSDSISGHFLVSISRFYLSLYLYYYPLLFSLCAHVWVFYNYHIRTLLQCPVLLSLIWFICYYRLIYLVLFNHRSH